MVKHCLCSEFKEMSYDPYDVKAVMDPVDFVVFDGLNEGEEVRSVTFLFRNPCAVMRPVTDTLRATVRKGNLSNRSLQVLK